MQILNYNEIQARPLLIIRYIVHVVHGYKSVLLQIQRIQTPK